MVSTTASRPPQVSYVGFVGTGFIFDGAGCTLASDCLKEPIFHVDMYTRRAIDTIGSFHPHGAGMAVKCHVIDEPDCGGLLHHAFDAISGPFHSGALPVDIACQLAAKRVTIHPLRVPEIILDGRDRSGEWIVSRKIGAKTCFLIENGAKSGLKLVASIFQEPALSIIELTCVFGQTKDSRRFNVALRSLSYAYCPEAFNPGDTLILPRVPANVASLKD